MRTRSVMLTVIALTFGTSAVPQAQSRATVVPSLSVSSVHDDNLFSRESPVGDYMTEFRPSLETSYESPNATLESLMTFDAQLSARHSALNTLDARRHAMFESRLRSTPSVTFGLAGRYDMTNTPGELNLESAIMLDRQRATRWQVTPSVAYRPRPRTTISLQYDWTNELLSQRFDADLHVARAGVSHMASPRTVWSLNYVGRLFKDAGLEHQSQSALFGWNRQLAPGTNLFLQAGPRITSYRGTTSEVLAAFIRKTPRSKTLIDYWHGETIVLGIHGPVAIQSGTTKQTWTVRRNLELGAHAGVFHSKTLEQAQARVFHTALVGAWTPRESYIVAVTYGADFQRGDIRALRFADDRIRRGVFLVRLTMAPRFSRVFKPRDEDPIQPQPPSKGVPR